MSSIKLVRLKNGAEEAEALVNVTMTSLGTLMDSLAGVTQFYDLTMVCRDSNYKIGERNLKALQDLALLQPDGRPHESIKNIVLSAVAGEGLGMKLSSPLDGK